MRHFIVLWVLVVIGVQLARTAEDGLIESTEAREDIAPSTDPASHFGGQPDLSMLKKGRQGETWSATAPRSDLGGQKRTCISCHLSLMTN